MTEVTVVKLWRGGSGASVGPIWQGASAWLDASRYVTARSRRVSSATRLEPCLESLTSFHCDLPQGSSRKSLTSDTRRLSYAPICLSATINTFLTFEGMSSTNDLVLSVL